MSGLPVSRLVSVSIFLSPTAAARANMNTLLIVGDSNIISTTTRVTAYASLAAIATAFGLSAPEYLAAAKYYGQLPQPLNCMIGRWLSAATAGYNAGAALTSGESAYTNFKNAKAAFKLAIDGASVVEVNEDTSACTTLAGVIAVFNAASEMTGKAVLSYDTVTRVFTITSSSTGADSSISLLTAPAVTEPVALDVGALFKMTAATGGTLTAGLDAETPVEAITACKVKSNVWYGSMFAATASITDAQHLAVADYIEAVSPARIYGINTSAAATLIADDETQIGYKVYAGNYNRTFVHYSSTSAYAVASIFGRLFTVDFDAANSTITLMYKVMPGVTAETLSEAEATALQDINVNVYAGYDNDTAIIQYGTMGSGVYIDEIQGLDWFANALQTDIFNALYTSTTKIPQTDDGQHQLVTVATGTCGDALNNGLIAAGTWNAAGFGQLKQGDFLPQGFYVYTAAMSSQSQANREARIAPPIQCAVKLAGAVHTIDAVVNVNR
jgi:hypothetical protein